MGLSQSKIGLLGHSHAVCLLDALGPWRDKAGIQTARSDLRPGEAFEGWYETDKGRAFVIRPTRTGFPVPSDLMTFLITGGMQDPLITLPTNLETSTEPDFTQPFLRYLDQLRDRDVVVSALFGNDVASLQLVDNLPPYDFAELDGLSSWSWPDPQYQPIDRVHIQRKTLEVSMGVISTVTTLQRRLPAARVIHVLPPPPLEHPDRLPPLGRRLGALIVRYGFVRAKLRLKWHFAYCVYVEAALRERGVWVLRAPDRARTPDGFLREELGEGLTHGNAHYGAMLWTDLDRLLS